MTEKISSEVIFDFIKNNHHHWEKGEIIIPYQIVNNSSIDEVTGLSENSVNLVLRKDNAYISENDLSVGDKINIIISPPRTKSCYFAENLDDVLYRVSSLTIIPDNFVVFDQDFISWKSSDPIPDNIQAYISLNKLISVFFDLSIFSNHHNESAIIVSGNKDISILLKTDESTITKYSSFICRSTEIILQILSNNEHIDEKSRIIKANLYSWLYTLPKEDRFSHLLHFISEFTKDFSNDFDLYISEFSFESKYENLLNQLQDFSNRLDSILSSIQGKILAIPISLILAFTQMKTDKSDYPLIVNSGVAITALVFSFLVLNLLNSQQSVLELLHRELIEKHNRFEKKIPLLYLEVKDDFAQLNNQYKNTKQMIVFLYVLIYVGIFATLIFYAILTPQVNHFFFSNPL